MIDRLLEFLSGQEAPALEESADELQLSVAALLIEAAHMDSSFDEAERATIERLLAKRFDLDHDAVQSLIAQAQQKVEHSAQYFPFTSQITKNMSGTQRAEIIEMLWKVAYSDGVLDPYEDALVRQIAGLIHVPDRERGLARRRALEKLKAAGVKIGQAK
jgi:uncharacterized tellurite resistance protein B-like protein